VEAIMPTVGFVQFEPHFGEAEKNRAAIRRLVEGNPGADLLVFPELAVSGYEFRDRQEVEALAEPFRSGPTGSLARELASATGATLVVGYAERAGEQLYNACFLVTPDGGFTNYRKAHLFSREKQHFQPGDQAPPVVETPAGRVGLMICFDWVFPETARLLALAGAQVIAQPANLVLQYCQRTMLSRSIENRVFTITANRVGVEARTDRSLTFTGSSQVTDTKGNILAQAPREGEHVGLAEVNVTEADDKWMTPENHLFQDRRTDLYGPLATSSR
jgi:predicted amidohydrolase